ncbi:hypothetical protein [Caviibacter abscessus]|uniref:hypothetical protein n=1 Tax=Caviibacter abscessus TaxID=1766719 RepID=UPI00083065F5|nr:hypothetical protein [Caviibacter abscessus]
MKNKKSILFVTFILLFLAYSNKNYTFNVNNYYELICINFYEENKKRISIKELKLKLLPFFYKFLNLVHSFLSLPKYNYFNKINYNYLNDLRYLW